MNYAIKCTIGTSEKILLLASVHRDRFYNVKEILSSPSLVNDVYLTSSDDVDFPYLVSPTDRLFPGENNELKDGETERPHEKLISLMTNIYVIFNKVEFNAQEELLVKLESQLKGMLTVDQLKQLQVCSKELKSYISGDRVKINMAPTWFQNYNRTKELVKEINDSGKAKELFIEGENKSLFTPTPTSEVFIRVPSYEELMLGGYLLPTFSDIIRPYEIAEFFTPNYKRYVSEKYPIELVTGNAVNNDLEIQPNEKRFYNGLKSLMDNGIAKEFPDKTVEECIKSNIGCTVVKDFIYLLVLMGASINWKHNGLIPINIESEISENLSDDDDDSNDNSDNWSTGKDEGNWDFYTESLSKIGFFDGASFLKDLVDELFNEDVYSIIDFAIKMLRFGSRKPSRIPIGKKGYLDLNSFRIVPGSGNYSSSEVLFDEEGNCLEVVGSIHMKDYMTDENYRKKNSIKISNVDMPVGIVCKKSFKNTDEYNTVAISFIDLIKAYENDEKLCKVKGIKLDNGELKFSKEVIDSLDVKIGLRELIAQITSNTTNSIQYYQYNGFEDAFMSQNCFDRKLSVLSIWNKFFSSRDLTSLSIYAYETKEELQDLCTNYTTPPRACVEANIARYIIPILCDVSNIYESSIMKGRTMNSADVAYCFSQSMKQFGFIGTFGDSKSLESGNSNIEKLNSFSRKTEKEEKVVNNMSDLSSFIDPSIDGMMICKIVLRKDLFNLVKAKYPSLEQLDVQLVKDPANPSSTIERITVGYLGVSQDKSKYKFLNPKSNVKSTETTMDAMKLSTALSSLIKKLSLNESSKYGFDDVESCNYYCNVINSMISCLSSFYLGNVNK